MQLPEEFASYTRNLVGEERWNRYLAAFDEVAPVSIRLNPFKVKDGDVDLEGAQQVPWCRNAFYLKQRPDFTMDPLLHAGVYYVQEASSMFLDRVLQQYMPERVNMALDLCAAPGGKSTLLRAALPDSATLFSNEPDRRRANILMENMQKQGHCKVVVTNNYAIDYQKARLAFDFVVCDVPCSGEGMFRKDSGAIGEWSMQNVMKCASLQKSIVEDIWPCLNEGGIMVYSTCTFNVHEDEENVKWICETLGAEVLSVDIEDEWNIIGSLMSEWKQPVYRFMPGTIRGEGLFMAVLRKCEGEVVTGKQQMKNLRVLSDGNPQPTVKGKNIIPAHAEALLYNLPEDKYPRAELSLEEAQRYLHHEALTLSSDVPKGIVIVTYMSHPLGFVKNIGNRANNLYPQEWKIRKGI